jgi:hypothetical protein
MRGWHAGNTDRTVLKHDGDSKYGLEVTLKQQILQNRLVPNSTLSAHLVLPNGT